jgi:hypothetical protein
MFVGRLFRPLRRFLADAGGSLSIEAAIMAPTLTFAIMLTYTTFDIFRVDATNSKAAYTIGDLLSRETNPVNQTYIDGMKDIFDYITAAPANSWLRVSAVRYDANDAEMKLIWSHAKGTTTLLTQETLDPVLPMIPDMADEDTVIVVETYMPYAMPFRVGIADFGYKETIITRPRFSAQLVWSNT